MHKLLAISTIGVLLGGGLMPYLHAAAATTAQTSLVCPPSVPISLAPASTVQHGWTAYVASELYLNSATPIDGPPEMHGELADYTTRPGKKEWAYTYDLDRNFPDGKWLECGYGTHNEVTLSQRMADSVKACTFTYRKGEMAGQNIIKINCH